MPFLGLGLHVFVALFFAVHAIRSGQPLYWLVILFSFPMLGSIVYFLVIYLPQSKLERGARKAVAAVAKTLDPSRELREARAAFDYTPTAQNQLRLAAALLEAGQTQEAAQTYERCLQGPFASDLEIRLGAARAFFACEQYAPAVVHLDFVRSTDANYRAEAVALLRAQALMGAGRVNEGRAEFESAIERFGSFECRAEYAIWAATQGDTATAGRLQVELQRSMERWNKHTRSLNMPLVRRLNAALESVPRQH